MTMNMVVTVMVVRTDCDSGEDNDFDGGDGDSCDSTMVEQAQARQLEESLHVLWAKR